MEKGCDSDKSGEISWSSSDEAERTFEVAYNTPIQNLRKKRRKKQTRNIQNLNFFDAATKNANSAKNEQSSPVLKSSTSNSSNNKDSSEEKKTQIKSFATSPILKPTKKPQYSPILRTQYEPAPNTKVKYLFDTVLSPEPRINDYITPQKQKKIAASDSPVIAVSSTASRRFVKNLNHELGCDASHSTANCDEKFSNSTVKCLNPIENFDKPTRLFNDIHHFSSLKENVSKLDDNNKLSFRQCNVTILAANAASTTTSEPSKKINIKSFSCNTQKMNVVPLKNGKSEVIQKRETVSKTLDISRNPSSPVLQSKRQLPDLISPPDQRIVKKIKCYFESNFSSENTPISIDSSQSSDKTQKIDIEFSQNSDKTHKSPIDIVESNSPTQSQVSVIKIQTEISSSSKNSSASFTVKNEEDVATKRKKKYKKDGLAGRLQSLVKKERNKIFLWRHELYLADNTNFVVPSKNQFRLFGIMKILPDFGCYVIDAIDIEDQKKYTVVLNTNYEYNVTITEKTFLKIFEPYSRMDTEIGSVIFDVKKFQCIGNDDKKL